MDHEPAPPSSETPTPSDDAHESSPREYDSSELLQGEKEVLIRHAGEVYRLRLTRNDKLILQK